MDQALQRRAVLAALAVYVLGFCAFWPNAILIADEAQYLGQATLFARGQATEEVRDVLHGTVERLPVSTYPAGTSAIEAPLVWLGGWRLGALASLVSLAGVVLLLLQWLVELERPPIFALLPLLFIGTLVPGRLAMSDAPSTLLATACFWLFSRGERGARFAWLAAGFLAGLSIVFRELTPLLFAPLFAGAVLRRERNAWQLVAGCILGGSARLLSSALLFGSPVFYRSAPVSIAGVLPNLALYLFVLCCCIPLGLPSLFLHRGARKAELILGGTAFIAAYLVHPLPHAANGPVRDIVLHSRFCAPLLPLLVFTLSEWLPRSLAGRAQLKQRWLAAALLFSALLSLTVHGYLFSWGHTIQRIAAVIYSKTPDGSVLLINPQGTEKFVSEALGHRSCIGRPETTPEEVARFVAGGTPVYVVFVDRTDAELRREDAAANASFLAALGKLCQVDSLYDVQESALEHVRIARVVKRPAL